MDAAGGAIDFLGEPIDVGRFQLRQRAVIEDQPRQRVFVGQFLQRGFGGRRLAGRGLGGHRQAQLVEQNLLNLLWRPDVERLARRREGRELDFVHPARQLAPLAAQHVDIHQYAAPLDA